MTAGLLPVLTGFLGELRGAGVPVSMVEAIDAMEALRHTDLADRAAFKSALVATLVKSARHQAAFDTAFEVYFALHRPQPGGGAPSGSGEGQGSAQGGGGEGLDPEQLVEALFRALRNVDLEGLRSAARRAVDRLAGMEPGRPVGGTYYLYRTLRRLEVDALQQRLLEALLAESGEMTPMELRMLGEEVRERIELLREELRAEIRRRLVADRGREAVARTLRTPLLEDLDLMHATRADLDQIEAIIGPLTRKLAARLARRRRRLREGRLDFRRTVRRSLSAGGVPVEPVFRTPRPVKPEIVLLCDISGSMATFARFTLQFVAACSSQFSKLRSFVFIDEVDEVTGLFEPGTSFGSVMARISSEAEVVWRDGHSDYGNALERFWARYGEGVTPRSTVIVTGDARNNYREARPEVLEEVRRASRALYWLNPEPRAYWDTGDSVMGRYTPLCDGAYEVRNLRQLEVFVEEVAVPTRGRVTLGPPSVGS